MGPSGTTRSQPGGPFEKIARGGQRVLTFDLRGMGETSPGKAPAWGTMFGADVKEAFLALHLNRPLLGQRVQDLLAVLTLRGKPCGGIKSFERKGESDYAVTCTDGHHYRVFIGPGNRVVIEDK